MASFGLPNPDPSIYNPSQNPYVLGSQPPTSPYGSTGAYSPYGGYNPNATQVPVLDANGNPVIDPATGQPKTTNQTSPDTSTMGFSVTGNEADVNPNASVPAVLATNRDTINTTGNTIGQEAGNQLGYYGSQQTDYTNAENTALNNLAATPGYNAAQSAAIMGDPNAPVATTAAGVTAEQAASDQYGQNLGAQLQQGEAWMGGAADKYATGVSGAATGLGQGLTAAQEGFDPLNTAVNNPNLKVSDQDVQNMVTAAGTTVGNQFQTAEDTLERQAAAQGNTSPAAQAALRQQLVTQEAATAGDTMTQAQIAAKQYQLGALQQQTGFQATAATTEEAAAQAAAAQAGQANISAQENIGQNTQATANTEVANNLNAANTYGQFDVGQQNTQTGQQTSAATTADTNSSNRATTVGNQAIAGQGAYRSGVASQAQNAQQGGQAAVSQQLGAYGTQTSGANSAASTDAAYTTTTNAQSLGNKLGTSVANLFGEGGTADTDMIAKVAEKGPEMIVSPVNALMKEGVRGRYKGGRRREDDEPVQFGVAA